MTDLEFTALYIAQYRNVTNLAAKILRYSRVPNVETEADAICSDVFVECLQKAQAGRDINASYLRDCAKFRSLDLIDKLNAHAKFISQMKSMASIGCGD